MITQETFKKNLRYLPYLKYLDDLRDSGVVNMFGAVPYLIAEFGIDKKLAKEALNHWMHQWTS